jgi:hypothetical protein
MQLQIPLLMAAFGLSSALSAQAAPTRITVPQAITQPGSYILANDITRSSSGPIITIDIQAPDVTLNLNGHTINANSGGGILIEANDINNNRSVVSNVHVSNGTIVSASYGITIYAGSCLINNVNVTAQTPITIEHGNSNRVHNCVLTEGQPGNGTVFSLFLTSYNTITDNTINGTFLSTIDEEDQSGPTVTVAGNNTFNNNVFDNPTPQ